jgi:hypothetical protein
MPYSPDKKQSPVKGRPSYLGNAPKRMTFKLPCILHAEFRTVSVLKGDSMAELMREFIADYVENNRYFLTLCREHQP